ncbi:hypothetical protein KIW84_055943 [Lathyrus oleraceus]|uniref:Transposase n=1 Tax=Pisum sativum TaxID=3888 RepID=A0A9D4WZ65_PEA|nr:hypothetical protein KIW84_055943 [Pisum sativum]
MDLDSDTETSLTNQHIFELYEFDEDNLEEEFEATNNIDESCEDNLQEEVETNNDTDEDEPYRTCKSKNFIAKVMFLVAQTRPRFDSEEKETFSGKLVFVFPFVTHEPAIRSSINRVAGTMVTKAITTDNARTHINHDDPLFREAATKDGFDIRLMCQPANSPDLNILDLGFFSAIQ